MELKNKILGNVNIRKGSTIGFLKQVYEEEQEDIIVEEYWEKGTNLNSHINIIRKAGTPRPISLGKQKVAAMPTDADFDNAAVYGLDIKTIVSQYTLEKIKSDLFLSVDYFGDCARVYADGVLVQDNFWNGKPMLVRLVALKGKNVEIHILPLRKDAPIYLQKEQRTILDASEGNSLLQLNNINLLRCVCSN